MTNPSELFNELYGNNLYILRNLHKLFSYSSKELSAGGACGWAKIC